MIHCNDALDELCDKVGAERAIAALEFNMKWTVTTAQASERKTGSRRSHRT